jgi:hypothetical protein
MKRNYKWSADCQGEKVINLLSENFSRTCADMFSESPQKIVTNYECRVISDEL